MLSQLPVVNSGWSCSRGDVEVDSGFVSLFPKTDESALEIVKKKVAAGAKLFVGLSGGKDSVSVCLLLKELGLPFTAIFADTGWEAEVTYNYVEWFCHKFDIDLVVVKNTEYDGMMDLIVKRGCFPKMKRRFCTEELKENPIAAYLQVIMSEGTEVISVAGIRADESKQRAQMKTWVGYDSRFNCAVWHPIFTWSYDDVIAMHHRHKCAPNPLYLLGAERVGCFPCVFGKKSELRIVSIVQPDRIDTLRSAESAVDDSVRVSKGDKYEERNYPTSTMFWMSINGQSRPALIDDVIQRAWKPSDKNEKAIIGEGTLAQQAKAAQDRWGWVLKIDGIDLDKKFEESDGAIHADYSHRYKTSADLKAEKADSEMLLFN